MQVRFGVAGLAYAVLTVIAAMSTGIWAYGLVTSHHSSTFWAVVPLATIAAGAILWGIRARHGQHFAGPVNFSAPVTTVNFFGSSGGPAPSAPVPTQSVLATSQPTERRLMEGTPDAYWVVDVWDLIEPTIGREAPAVRGWTLRYVELRGPAILAPVGEVAFNNVSFGIARDNFESILWDPGDRAQEKLGPILLQDCQLEHCRTSSIGFTGSPAAMAELRQLLGLGS